MVSIPVHVWGRSDITAVFELGDSDWKWRHPNTVEFSAEIGDYGSHVSVEGPTLISERELQVLFAERPKNARELEAEPGGVPGLASQTPQTRKRGRRARAKESAMRSLADLYPNGIPNVPWKTITAEVNAWLNDRKEMPVSDDTVRRAASEL